jgi:hypothetical protein
MANAQLESKIIIKQIMPNYKKLSTGIKIFSRIVRKLFSIGKTNIVYELI